MLESPFQSEKKHNKTIELKKDLTILGFANFKNPNDYYASQTKSAVEKFQKKHGLPVSGIADEHALHKIKTLVKDETNIRIFIDAGHGGVDSGATGNGLKEIDLTIDIAKRIQEFLGAYKGVAVKMSCTTDKSFELSNRVKLANDWNADFYFSVHINSFTSSNAHGFESFIYNGPPTKDEIEKQNIIHNNIVNNMNFTAECGKKEANFHVLRETNMTAMLVEYLFITNKNDSNYLKNANYRDRLAKHIADDIAKAYNLKK